jgi:hypothetical protein
VWGCADVTSAASTLHEDTGKFHDIVIQGIAAYQFRMLPFNDYRGMTAIAVV